MTPTYLLISPSCPIKDNSSMMRNESPRLYQAQMRPAFVTHISTLNLTIQIVFVFSLSNFFLLSFFVFYFCLFYFLSRYTLVYLFPPYFYFDFFLRKKNFSFQYFLSRLLPQKKKKKTLSMGNKKGELKSSKHFFSNE